MTLRFPGKYHTFVLVNLMILFMSVNAIASGITGYVVGRAFCRLDGYNNQHKTIITEATVELEYYSYALKEPKKIRVQTDTDGYFYLANQPLEGSYRVSAIISDGLEIHNPDSRTGRLAAPVDIIDLGEHVFILLQNGESGYERYGANTKRTLVKNNGEVAFSTVEGDYGYPGLDYFSRQGDEMLRESALIALEDRRLYEEAVSYTKRGDEAAESKKKEAVENYARAVEVYPTYGRAYEGLFRVFERLDQEEDLDIIKHSLYLYKNYIVSNPEVKYLMFNNPVTRGYYKCSWLALQEGQYNLGIKLLNKALFQYVGDALSEKKMVLERGIPRSRNQQKLQQYWMDYLLTIQSQDDMDNWKGRPFDLYIEQY